MVQICSGIEGDYYMPVCLRCGGQIADKAKFCGWCGYPVKNQTRTQQTASNNQTVDSAPPQIRTMEELIEEIDHMLSYFSKIQSLYDECDRLEKIRREKLRPIERRHRRRRRDDSNDLSDMSFYEIIYFLFFTFSAFLILAILFVFIIVTWPYSLMIAIGCTFFSGLFCFLGVRFVIKEKRRQQEEFQDICRDDDQIKEILAQIKEYHKGYGYCLVNFVDANPRLLTKTKSYLLSGKAKTLEKAVLMARR